MEREKIDKLRGIFNKYELQLLVLFGSYESKHFNESSDLDLAVQVTNVEQLKKTGFLF